MTTVNGIPVHILLVHAIVVLLPLSALLLVLTAIWSGVRRRLAGANALLSLLVLALVPLTTDAGEWLERRVTESALVKNHAELGDSAVIVTIPVVLLALVIWWRGRESATLTDSAPTDSATPQNSAHGVAATSDAPSATRTATIAKKFTPRRILLAPTSKAVSVVIIALSVIAAGAATYDIYRIGDSGAKASWTGGFTDTPTAGRSGN